MGDNDTFQLPEQQHYGTPREEALNLSNEKINQVGEATVEGQEQELLTRRALEITNIVIQNRTYFIVNTPEINLNVAGFREPLFTDADEQNGKAA